MRILQPYVEELHLLHVKAYIKAPVSARGSEFGIYQLYTTVLATDTPAPAAEEL